MHSSDEIGRRFELLAAVQPRPRRCGPRTGEPRRFLERVLDKGIVIAGDIRVNLLDIELLTIKLRLVIASLETAREVGIDWWEHDPWLSGGTRDLELENKRLRARIEALESGEGRLPGLTSGAQPAVQPAESPSAEDHGDDT